jgi:hypothetical protein
MTSTEAEIAPLMYKYRRLITEVKISPPPEEAAKLIGPDSAHRLYFSISDRHANKDNKQLK